MPAIPFNDRYQKVTPASSTDEITLDFPIASTADLKVLVDGTETVDFTVTATFADGIATGAKLNINTPVVSNPTVEIIGDRNPSRTQFTVSSGHDLVGKINAEIAQRTLENQESHRDVARGIKVAFGETGFTLPDAATRATKYFGWDGAGNPEMRLVTKAELGLGNVTNDAQLKIASNLADLGNAGTARSNLGLGALALGANATDVPYSNASSSLTATDVQAAIDEIEAADLSGKVDVAGDTMTGALVLSGDPTADLEAATKQYVDGVAVSGVSDGDKGDITVTDTGATWTIDSGVIDAGKLGAAAVETTKIADLNVTTGKLAGGAVTTAKVADSAVTYVKMQNVSATDRFLGRRSAGAGPVEELTAAQATARLNVVTTSLKGLAPILSNDADTYLDGTGNYSKPAGGPTLTTEVDLTNGGLNDTETFELATGLPSGISTITVMMNGWSVDVSDDPIIQLQTSGGWVTTGYDAGADDAGSTNTDATAGFLMSAGTPPNQNHASSYTLHRIGGTNKWMGRGITYPHGSAGSMVSGAGSIALGAAVTGVRVTLRGVGQVFNNGTAGVQHQ